ncbi:protein turtle homolog A-like isoform X3 [Haemaphysalis longicornis]
MCSTCWIRIGRLLHCTLTLLTLGVSSLMGIQSLETTRKVTVVLTEGASADLPCDLGPRSDPAVKVWWHRADDPTTPLYTLDPPPGRRGNLMQARHSVAEPLRGRAHFSAVRRPALLSISSLRYEDHGLYVCNVEYKHGSRRSYDVELHIIVPPGKPVILDENLSVLNGTVGPSDEGMLLILNCHVSGGKPEPRVMWRQGSTHLHHVFHRSEQGVKKATLHVRSLRRDHLGAVFTCEATNSNLTRPAATSVTLSMNLKPVHAVIRGKQDFLSAEFRAEVECEAEGSLPPALVSWWLDGVRLNASLAQSRVSAAGNVTTSLLGFVPRARDNGRQLRCVAANPKMPGHEEVADVWLLQVHYKPRVSLAWGNRVNRSSIVQGTDVYFECEVDANPRLIEVSWRFEGHELASRLTNFIVSNQSLALRGVQSANSGHYSCVAANAEGAAESNRVFLRVQHLPVCDPDLRTKYTAARHEELRVHCSVLADPWNVSFHWSLNGSSGHRRDLQWALSSTTDSRGLVTSYLRYTPRNESDFGTLSCSARNAIGLMMRPCVIHVVPVGPPKPPHNCNVSNQTMGALRVDCEGGAEPGHSFLLEVHELQRRRLVANMSSATPSFWVDDVPPGTKCTLLVYAFNGRVRSEPVLLSTHTLANAAQGFSEPGPPWLVSSNILVSFLVVAICLLVAIPFIVLIAIKYKAKTPEDRGDNQDKQVHQEKHWIQLSQGVEHRNEPSIFPEEAFVTAMTSFQASTSPTSVGCADGRVLYPRSVC